MLGSGQCYQGNEARVVRLSVNVGCVHFCHPDCERSWQAARDRAKADQSKLREYLLGKYPGLTIKGIHGGDKYGLYASVEFPGGSGSFTQAVSEEAIYLSTAAMEAWVAFAADCQPAAT